MLGSNPNGAGSSGEVGFLFSNRLPIAETVYFEKRFLTISRQLPLFKIYVLKIKIVLILKRIKNIIVFRQNLNLIRLKKRTVYTPYIYRILHPAPLAKVPTLGTLPSLPTRIIDHLYSYTGLAQW